MSNEPTTNHLHLPDLSITNFRGIEELTIPRLGRVTLIAGRNGVGKTTVLEAARVHAARGRSAILNGLLSQREEFVNALDEDYDPEVIPDIAALFYGREPERRSTISVGPINGRETLTIQLLPPSAWTNRNPELFPPSALTKDQLELFADLRGDNNVWALKVQFQDAERILPWIAVDEFQDSPTRHRPPRSIPNRWLAQDWPEPINCQTLGPGLLGNHHLASLWGSVALTDDEDRATEALKILHGDGIERVAVVGPTHLRRANQRILVKFAGKGGPVPLRSLGDGAVRIFGVVLALANSHNGFLVIDEAENGIHHSAQKDFWSMVLTTAQRNNVQVLATTHSWDCVAGFAQASSELNDVEGVLIRLEAQQDGVSAVEYTESDLMVAAEQRIEVR